MTLPFAEEMVAPKAEISYPFIVYAGPKDMQDLEEVKPPVVRRRGNARDASRGPPRIKLDKAVDVTFAILSRPSCRC